MLFKNKTDRFEVTFDQLKPGETFITDINSSSVFIKTEAVKAPFSGIIMNSVNLTNGGYTQVRGGDLVIPVIIQEVGFIIGREE